MTFFGTDSKGINNLFSKAYSAINLPSLEYTLLEIGGWQVDNFLQSGNPIEKYQSVENEKSKQITTNIIINLIEKFKNLNI